MLNELFSRSMYCIQGKFRCCFIFALWPEGEFKTGLILLSIKDYVRKLESGPTLASDPHKAKIRLGKFKSCITISSCFNLRLCILGTLPIYMLVLSLWLIDSCTENQKTDTDESADLCKSAEAGFVSTIMICEWIVFSSPEPKAQVSYCHSALSVRPSPSSVNLFHIFNFFSRTAWWILMKLAKDEVLMVPYKCCCFSARSAQGLTQDRKKTGHGGFPSSSDRKVTATNRMHSNDLEACGKKCRYFWFHSEAKFMTCFWHLFGLCHFCVF